MDLDKNSFEFASSQILKKGPSGGASPLRTTVCTLLAGAFFLMLILSQNIVFYDLYQNDLKFISKGGIIARNGILDPIQFWWVP